MAITAKMVSELRERTGAAMMDCKKALEATGGDPEAALDQLRKQGLKSAAKKPGRETAEGRVFAVVPEASQRGHLVGVACETDFLSNSDGFKEFVAKLGSHVEGNDPNHDERLRDRTRRPQSAHSCERGVAGPRDASRDTGRSNTSIGRRGNTPPAGRLAATHRRRCHLPGRT